MLAGALTFLATVQLRSQEAVARSLAGQDAASLAFRIDDLHRANERLAGTSANLERQRQSLSRGGNAAATAALSEERQRLEVVEGLVPVSGPGVSIQVDAPLAAADVQAAVDNLRLGGAEAIEVDGVRVVTGTPVLDAEAAISIGGTRVRGPWTFDAIGDPSRLTGVAGLMTQSLRTDVRVRSVGFTVSLMLDIRSVVRRRPFVYSSPS